MTFSDIQFGFNRAVAHSFSLQKNGIAFFILLLCGLLAVFFRGIAGGAGEWVTLSLLFVPLFITAGVLFSMGILLIRVYHDEVKGREISYSKIFSKSWELVVGASYFSIPIILSYLLLWMLLGVFMMLREIPGLGEFIGVVLSFAPFIINFLTLVLVVLNFALLFFVSPVLALKGLNRHMVVEVLVKRWQKDPFSNLVLGFVALLPLLFVLALLVGAATITGQVCINCSSEILTVMEWFFIMIPFTAFLAPAVVFFFNFAAEAHILQMKQIRQA